MLHNSNTIIGTPKWNYQSSFFLTHHIKNPLYSLSPAKIPMPQKNGTMRAMEVGEENLLEPVNENACKLPEYTLGHYLACRLVQIGITDIFGVPGDANLTLLDQFIAEPGIELISCCNELNAGYAADGYARARRVGACVFTFFVGGLSALNTIAGAYSENIPLICIVGGPNSNYYGKNVTLHHTIGLPDCSQELKCFESVTCYQAVVTNLEDAHEQIDRAITTALRESKPVYISISCNLPGIPHPSFRQKPLPFFLPPRTSNPICLEAAVEAAAEVLNKAERPVLVAGIKLRLAKSCEAFVDLANTCGYAIATMPTAKGLVPENHPQFMGTYWGRPTSSPLCAETVESADACLYAGAIFDDLSTSGYSIHLDKETSIIVQPQRVVIGNKLSFRCVLMEDFLRALGQRLTRNARSFEDYQMMFVRTGLESVGVQDRPKEALKADVLFKHVQKMVSSDSVVVVEAGDAWFYTQKLKLPQGCGFEVQMHYASIGWSVGAALGYAQAAPHTRVIACIGDGSFQMVAQEVSTMLRYGQRSIIFLTNNGGYAIEAKIHDGPYNVIKNWDYTALVNAIHNGHGNYWATQVRCEEELVAAIDMAMGDKKDYLCLIELMLRKHDTSKELLHWVAMLAAANASPPCPR